MPNLRDRISSSNARLRPVLYALRGVLCYLCFIGTLHLAEYALLTVWKAEPDFASFEYIVYFAACLAIVPFLYYSISRAFALADTYGYEQSLDVDEQGVTVRWRDVIGNRVFALQLLAMLALHVALPHAWGWGMLFRAISFNPDVHPWLLKGMLAPVLLVFIVLLALSHRSARHEWQRIRYRRSQSAWRVRPKHGVIAFFQNETGVGGLLGSLLLIVTVYTLGSIVAIALIIVLVPLLRLAVQFWYVVLILAALLFIPDYLLSFRKRRRLIVGIRRICRERGYELSAIRTPYWSLLYTRKGADFTVKVGETTYACKLLAHHSLPTMRFDLEGTAELTMPIKFRYRTYGRMAARPHDMGVSLVKRKVTYAFESEHRKVLLLCPVPAHTLITGPNGGAELDTGAHIGDYRLYNTTGFLGALERNCLDR